MQGHPWHPGGWMIAAVLVTALAGCSTAPERAPSMEREEPAPSPPERAPSMEREEPPPSPPELPVEPPTPSPGAEIGRGPASWYGPRFHGRRTASGERFDMNQLTAAHRTLPFGSRVLVRNLRNGREVVVRINDRGPRARDRIIDLSKAAAAVLDMLHAGEAFVVLLEQ